MEIKNKKYIATLNTNSFSIVYRNYLIYLDGEVLSALLALYFIVMNERGRLEWIVEKFNGMKVNDRELQFFARTPRKFSEKICRKMEKGFDLPTFVCGGRTNQFGYLDEGSTFKMT